MIAASGPIVRSPTLEQLREYAARLEQERQIPSGLYSTLVQAESSWNPQAVSPTGARGLAQIIPSTGRQPGFGVQPVKNIDDPFENLRFGSDYLGAMLKRYGGDKEAALLAYNQGPGYADKWIRAQRNFAALPEKVRAEGQPYVQKILRGIADAVIPAAYAADEPDAGFAQLESELDAVAGNGLNPQEQFLYDHHLGNLKRGGVKTPEGLATARQITVDMDGKTFSLPTVWDNQILAEEDAIRRAEQIGFNKFPSYASPDEAQARYEQAIHPLMERDIQGSSIEADLDAFAELDAQAPQGDFRTPGTPAFERVRNENVLRAQFQEPGRPQPAPLSEQDAEESEAVRGGYGALGMAAGLGQTIRHYTGMDERPNNLAVREISAAQRDLKPEGTDWARAGGEAAFVALPAAMLGPAGAAHPYLAAAGTGALGGFLTGAAQPVEDTENYDQQKAMQVGVGALTGAAVGPLARFTTAQIGRAVQGVANVVRRAFGPGANSQQVNAAVEVALRSNGINPAHIDRAIREDLNRQVVRAMAQGGAPSAEALANQTALAQLGIQGTRGQITRNPLQWQTEFNTRAREGGEPLMNQYRGALRSLVGGVDDVRAGTGGQPGTPYSVGERATRALSEADEAARQRVSAAYQAARQTAGRDADVPLQRLAQDYAQTLEDFGDVIPAAIRGKFESLGLLDGRQTRVFTTASAEKLLQDINQFPPSPVNPAQATALRRLREAVKTALVDADVDGVFSSARALARQRFSVHDAIPALKAVVDDKIAPDDFLKKFVDNAKVQDLSHLKSFLTAVDRQSWDDIRLQVVDKLRRSAVRGEGQDVNFLYDSYRKALQAIPEEKLRILFTPQERQQLALIERAARAVQAQPAGAVPNRSGTAIELMNQLGRLISKIPGGGMVANITATLSGPARSRATANAALRPGNLSAGQNALLSPEVLNLIGRSAALGGAGSANSLLQQ